MSSSDHGESDQPIGVQPYVYSDDDDETGLNPALPASTLVVFREAEGAAPPDLLMVRRSKAMKFASGAAVFPGGRVDADDYLLGDYYAATLAIDPRDAAARVAAVRETIEETGLALGLANDLSEPALVDIRAGLLADQPFSALLDRHTIGLALDRLLPFSRWRPNFAHPRTFDTRFYIAQATDSIPELSVVAAENSELFWVSAQDALGRADAGVIDIIFPTRRNLERLAAFATYADAVDSAQRHPARRITPYIVEESDGVRYLCIRDDCGYPVIREAIGSAMRG